LIYEYGINISRFSEVGGGVLGEAHHSVSVYVGVEWMNFGHVLDGAINKDLYSN